MSLNSSAAKCLSQNHPDRRNPLTALLAHALGYATCDRIRHWYRVLTDRANVRRSGKHYQQNPILGTSQDLVRRIWQEYTCTFFTTLLASDKVGIELLAPR